MLKDTEILCPVKQQCAKLLRKRARIQINKSKGGKKADKKKELKSSALKSAFITISLETNHILRRVASLLL